MTMTGKISGPCAECKVHLATERYAESVTDWAHGHFRDLCRCCLLAQMTATMTRYEETVAGLREELAALPCHKTGGPS